jgi:hypothetical protein
VIPPATMDEGGSLSFRTGIDCHPEGGPHTEPGPLYITLYRGGEAK